MTKSVTSRFVLKGDNQLQSAFSKAQKQMADLGRKVALFSSAAVAGATAIVKAQAGQIDSLAKTADVVGVTIESLQALRYEAELNGVAAQGMDDSLRRLQRRAGEFANSGGGPAAKAFETLGISVRDANGEMKGTDVLYREIIAAMEPIGSVAQQSALAAQLFGDDFGPKLVPLINQGVKGIEDAYQTLEDLGILISDSEAAGVERMNDAMYTAGLVGDGLAKKFTAELAPAIAAVAEQFIESSKESGGLGEGAADAADLVVDTMGVAMDATDALGRGFKVAANAGIIGFESLKGTVVALAESIINGPTKAVNFFLRHLNLLPGASTVNLDFQFPDLVDLKSELNLSAGIIREAQAEIDAILMEDLPSEAFKDRVAKIREELANALAEGAGDAEGGGGLNIVDPEEVKRLDKIRDALAGLMGEVAAFGATEEDQALLKLIDLGADEDQIAQARLILDELRILREQEEASKNAAAAKLDMEREYASLVQSLQTPLESHVATVDRITELYDAGIIPGVEEYAELLNRVTENYDESIKKVSEMDEFGKQAARNMQTHFADFLFDPFDEGLKGMLQGFSETLRRMAAEAAAASLFKKIFGEEGGDAGWLAQIFGGGSSDGGGFGAFLSSLFGGARAMGGPVAAGVPYLVGERGPEIVVPRQHGTVLPNHALGRPPQTNNFVQNIYLPPETSRRTAQQHAVHNAREAQYFARRNL